MISKTDNTKRFRVYIDEFQGCMGHHKTWVDCYCDTLDEASTRAKEIEQADSSHWTSAFVQERKESIIPEHIKVTWRTSNNDR